MESLTMENWDDNNWSSSSDSDETGSSYSDESNSSLRMEAVRVSGESFLLPQGLCDNPDVFKEFFSLDLWNSFSEDQRQHLENFLPSFPQNDSEEKNKTLRMLFNRENIRFGNPLDEFQKQLRDGNFRPDVSRLRSFLKRVQYKDYKRSERWRMYKLMKSVLSSRQRLVNAVVNGEKPKVFPNLPKKGGVAMPPNVKSRYFQELALIKEEIGETTESSEDDNYPEGPLSGLVKKTRRSLTMAEAGLNDGPEPVIGTLCAGPSPWDQGKIPHNNPYYIPEQSYSQMLALHSKRRSTKEDHPDLLTDGLALHDVAQRCSKFLKRSSGSKAPIIIKKSKVKFKKEPSVSSPVIEEELNDTISETEDNQRMMVKLKPDIEEEIENIKVDIEGMDDLPSLPIIVRQHSNMSSHCSSSPSNKPLGIKRLKEAQDGIKRSVSTGSNTSTPSLEEIVRKVSRTVSPVVMTTSSGIEQKKGQVTVIKAEPEVSPSKPRLPLTPATLSDLDGIDMMDLPVDFDESPPLSFDDMTSHQQLMQDTHTCFFSLIRDILLSTPDHRMEPRELEMRVKAWANSPIAPLNPWYSPQLESRLQSAILFLTGDSSEPLPEDYVPYMEWKIAVKAYQWIGAGRDSDTRLSSLCAMWSERSSGTPSSSPAANSTSLGVQASSGPPPPRGPAVQPTSPQDRLIFRQQEKQRYATPFRAFTYRVGGVERVVGPVRSTQAGNLSKARGHTLLVDDRPKYVTILELVRDAVSRLPNAQGTRADIVTLLKDSQYLSESAQEAVLSSVVSGALDRLHYEHDPSVKYDSKRKIWVYLHRGRSVEEHERLHALGASVKVSRPKSARKQSKQKKDVLPKMELPESSEVGTITDTAGMVNISTPGSPSPILMDAKMSTASGSTTPKRPATSVPTKKLIATEGGVKSLLGKPTGRSKSIDSGQSPIRTQQSAPNNVGQQKTGSILPARTIVQDTNLVRAQPHNFVKKTVALPGESMSKGGTGKSVVKVIASSQAPSHSPPTPVRTVQRAGTQTSNSAVQQAQQLLQLKHQLLSSGDKIVKASTSTTQTLTTASVKKQSTNQSQQTTQTQPQQVIVMKPQSSEGSGGGQTAGGIQQQQQMIVINQQQILVDSLTAKHQKQLQQLLSKQQQVEQQQSANQAIQLILGKQQSSDTKMITTASKGTTPMIVVKGGDGAGTSGKSGGQTSSVSQMFFVKQTSGTNTEGEQTSTTHITQQHLQQILLKNQQAQVQNQQAGGVGQGQAVAQQMIIVKPDQKSVQVIPQAAGKGVSQSLTLAQFQQLQQQQQQLQQQQSQQQQQRAATTSLLNHPRVVAHVSTTGGTSVIKPQVVTSGSQSSVLAKVVPATAANAPIITMESLLNATATKHPQTHQVRMPVSRGVPPQYAVVTLPQQRVVQTSSVQVSGSEVAPSSAQTLKMATTQGVRIPGLNLAQIAGKQVLLASKPAQTATLQGQNVVLGGSGGQALLVSGSSGGQQLTLLQQGSQQILLPPGALKNIQNLKVIPLASGKTPQQGRQQVFARIINPGNVRPVITNIVQETTQQPPPSTSKD